MVDDAKGADFNYRRRARDKVKCLRCIEVDDCKICPQSARLAKKLS